MNAKLETAMRALQAGRLPEAEAACRGVLAANPADVQALQVLGVVLRHSGKLEEAEASFRRSVDLAPSNPEFRTNLAQLLGARGRTDESVAHFQRAIADQPRFRPAHLGLARLANRVQRHALAEQHARQLIAIDARDSEAWSALGTALHGLGRLSEARSAFQRALTIAPNYGAAHYQLAATLAEEERALEALEHVGAAARAGIAHRGLVLTRARALMQLDRYDEAERALLEIVRGTPDDVEVQTLLVQLRHVRGDQDFARALREAATRPGALPAVRAAYADTLRRSGDLAGSEQLLRELLREHGPLPALMSSLATVLQETGRHAEAVSYSRAAAEAQPHSTPLAENYVAALLCAGDPRAALPTIERFRQLTPLDQRWITYRADASRQLGESLFDEWCDLERLVRVYDIEPPPGYASIEAFHETLRPLLEARHRQAMHPLDQSLRFGTQTSRGLLVDNDPVIKAFLSALEAPMASYQAEIGRDDAHPLLARNTDAAKMVGCWSVRLKRGGFHVNHIHPQGWMSSAYYVSVPAEVEDTEARSGWIKFGEPRFAMPGATAGRFVQPRAGRLVLFPSYLWHGTTPIHGDEARLTVAFDAVPARPK